MVTHWTAKQVNNTLNQYSSVNKVTDDVILTSFNSMDGKCIVYGSNMTFDVAFIRWTTADFIVWLWTKNILAEE